MPKKQAKNAFFYFMLDFKQKQQNRGVRFHGMPEVSTAASVHWTRMTAQEKGPYEKMAKDGKVMNSANNAAERYTAQGVAFSVKDKEASDLKKAESDMKKHITEIVTSSYLDNTIASQEYHFIACNYFCKTSDGTYVPAELALIKYSLESGKLKVWHTYIKPDKLPTGYAFEAKDHSDKTHRLPPPPKADGERDYAKILREICKFFGDNQTFPPLFTNVDQIKPINSIIEQLCMDANEDPETFKVYPLAQLFYVLKGKAVEYDMDGTPDDGLKSIHIAQAIIDQDRWDHCKMIACQFHETEDVSKFCALSCVARWAFIFSDNICNNLKIDLIPGQHLPINADISVGEALKIDLEETKSMYSYADDQSIASSRISQPTKYRAGESVMSASTYNDERRNDYPGLSARYASSSSSSSTQGPPDRHATTQGWENVGKTEPDEDDDDGGTWTSQASRKARKPKEESFSFNANATANRGFGRGALLNDDFPSMSSRGGRGRATRGRF